VDTAGGLAVLGMAALLLVMIMIVAKTDQKDF
jgi:hypothetical protein